jgi:hypothetical protein
VEHKNRVGCVNFLKSGAKTRVKRAAETHCASVPTGGVSCEIFSSTETTSRGTERRLHQL